MTDASAFVRYVARRLAMAVPTLAIVAILVFALLRMIPGDPAQVMLGEGADPAAVAALRIELGLDRPLWRQFAGWLWQVLHGDLGSSILTGQPVAALVWDRFQVTATIVVAAVVIATLAGVAAGLYAASRRGRRGDGAVVAAATLTMALPGFWLGIMLILLFGVTLRWLPVVGFVPLSAGLGQSLPYLVLPVTTLAIVEFGVIARMTRGSAIEVMDLAFVTHARAKGLSGRRVMLRHVLPNAFAPVLTVIGLTLGHLLGGAAVVETVFTLPGLGRLMVDAVLGRDYPVVQGCLLFTAALYVLVNLTVDLIYPLLDPRIGADRR